MPRPLLTAFLLAWGTAQSLAVPQPPPAPQDAIPALTVPAALAALPIFVAYPKDGYKVAADHVIFEGSVLPGASLSVNGRALNVGPDGLFSEWLPLNQGVNVLTLTSVLGGKTSILKYSVTSSTAARLPVAPATIAPGSLTPDGPWVRYGTDTLSVQDRRLEVSFRGSPGGRAMFWAGERGPYAMTETAAGHYSGGFTLGAGEPFSGAKVRVLLTAPGGSRAQATAPGSVSSLPGPRFIEVTAPDIGRGVNAYLAGWATAGGPNLLYPRQGTRVQVLGETTGVFLTRLPGLPLLEITRATSQLLPAGTVPISGFLGTPQLQDTGSHLALRLPLGARVPVQVIQTASGLTLALYDTQGDPASLNAQLLSDPLMTGLTWSRAGNGPLMADVRLSRQQWGYDATYDGTTLVLRVRRPPTAPADPAQPLAGRTIVIDPGHGGSEQGGAGALRVQEKDIVLNIGLQVAGLLRAQGANVVLTRESDVQVPLYTRPLLAEAADADLLLSIHANALPDGTDPRGRRGAGVYFTNPQALLLAVSILKAIVGSPALAAQSQPGPVQPGPAQPGNDGLHPDADLALTRPSTQISLLVETAYLTDPGNLRSLMSDGGRAAYAQAITQGVLDFYAAAALP